MAFEVRQFVWLSVFLGCFNIAEAQDSACPGPLISWSEYTSPGHEFRLRYPASTHPQIAGEHERGVSFRVIFPFEQKLLGVDHGTLRFSVQVAKWHNPGSLTAEAWAISTADLPLVSAMKKISLGGAEGYFIRKTDLTSLIVQIFLPYKGFMYEASHLDLSVEDSLLSASTRSCWVSTLDKIMNSLSFF